jgi:hypothetical protein
VDGQGRKQQVFETVPATPGACKALPVDPCAPGKIRYKAVTLTFGGWVDLDTGSVYNFIPFQQSKNFNMPESRFSARQTRFSVLTEGDAVDTHIAGYGEIDFEGAAQTANSVATNSFDPRMRRSASPSIAPTSAFMSSPAKHGRSMPEQGRHRSALRRCAGRDRFSNRSRGFLAARQPRIRVWRDIGPEFKVAASVENPQTSFFGGNTPTVGTPAVGPQGGVESEPARQPDRSRRQLLQ